MTPLRPRLELLDAALVQRILGEAHWLLQTVGVKVQSVTAQRLLTDAGAALDNASQVVRLPPALLESALKSVPSEFDLYDLSGSPAVHYGGDAVQFDPGSCAVHVLDAETLDHRPSTTSDLIRLVKVAEMLPQYAAQSTAVVCSDVPKEIGDLYRLYIVLLHSSRPVVTGAFSLRTLEIMLEMLAIFSGGRAALAKKPRAVFDVCPSPPLIWTEFAAENMIALARAGVPAQIVSMPLAGAAAPVTLIGAVVQHAAECLSGIAIHQLAGPGAPVVWGGAPAIFDMRKGNTPMGAIETAMIDAAYAQVGQSLGIPTHAYLGASDAKLVDYQSGLESGLTAMIGTLAGINMISGAGMLDFLACQSPEKLVADAEAIGMAQRLLQGVQVRTESLAALFFEEFHFQGEFLKQRLTRDLFREEQYLPSQVIDRDSIRGWQQDGGKDTWARARQRVGELLLKYTPPALDPQQAAEMHGLVSGLAPGVLPHLEISLKSM